MNKKESILAVLWPLLQDRQTTNAEITEDSTLRNDLGLDSLDEVELCIAIERHYTIVIHDDVQEAWKTVADVVETVNSLIK